MKNYDNYFLPVDNMEEEKRYYEEIITIKKKYNFYKNETEDYNIEKVKRYH